MSIYSCILEHNIFWIVLYCSDALYLQLALVGFRIGSVASVAKWRFSTTYKISIMLTLFHVNLVCLSFRNILNPTGISFPHILLYQQHICCLPCLNCNAFVVNFLVSTLFVIKTFLFKRNIIPNKKYPDLVFDDWKCPF